MKLRIGFVSNSSSSSFIIAFDYADTKTVKLEDGSTLTFDVQTFIDAMKAKWEIHSESTFIREETEQVILEHTDYWEKEAVEELKKFFKKNQGKEFIDLQIEYQDHATRKWFNLLRKVGLIDFFDYFGDEYLKEDEI